MTPRLSLPPPSALSPPTATAIRPLVRGRRSCGADRPATYSATCWAKHATRYEWVLVPVFQAAYGRIGKAAPRALRPRRGCVIVHRSRRSDDRLTRALRGRLRSTWPPALDIGRPRPLHAGAPHEPQLLGLRPHVLQRHGRREAGDEGLRRVPWQRHTPSVSAVRPRAVRPELQAGCLGRAYDDDRPARAGPFGP